MLEVDEWEDAQVAAREQVARAKLDSYVEACRLVSSMPKQITPLYAGNVRELGLWVSIMRIPVDVLPQRRLLILSCRHVLLCLAIQ